jgi:hypothetical protein
MHGPEQVVTVSLHGIRILIFTVIIKVISHTGILRASRQLDIPKGIVTRRLKEPSFPFKAVTDCVAHETHGLLSKVHKKKWRMIIPLKGGWFSATRRHFIHRDE